MPSFDIVSKTDMQEVDNAIQGVTREIAQRYDFKGSKCSVARKDKEVTILADDEFRSSFAARVAVDDRELADRAVTEPDRSVLADVRKVRSSPLVPDRVAVSGHVYDVETGLVTTIS